MTIGIRLVNGRLTIIYSDSDSKEDKRNQVNLKDKIKVNVRSQQYLNHKMTMQKPVSFEKQTETFQYL